MSWARCSRSLFPFNCLCLFYLSLFPASIVFPSIRSLTIYSSPSGLVIIGSHCFMRSTGFLSHPGHCLALVSLCNSYHSTRVSVIENQYYLNKYLQLNILLGNGVYILACRSRRRNSGLRDNPWIYSRVQRLVK
mgnify:FL=1